MGIRPGQVLDVREDEGKLVMTKVVERDPVDRVFGILKLDKSTDEIIEDLRGPADLP